MTRVALAIVCAILAAPGAAAAAQRPHVVMIVFDELPADSLLDARGHVDGERFPGFARLARTSTWFPNAHSVYDSTRHAVPAILDGRLPRTGRRPDWRDHRGSVFDVFGRRGWRMEVSEEASTVCRPRWCGRRPEPDFIDVIRILGGPRGEELRAGLGGIRPARRATFWFFHSLLPHTPWIYLPSGRRYPAAIDDGPRGFSGPRSFHDRFLAVQAHQRHLLQLGFLDREIGRLIDRLRRTGMWRRTMVVVTADHGLSFATDVRGRRYARRHNLHELAPVPLFIRRPGQARGRVRQAAARTVDVVPTMADVLGLRLGWTYRAGRSALSRSRPAAALGRGPPARPGAGDQDAAGRAARPAGCQSAPLGADVPRGPLLDRPQPGAPGQRSRDAAAAAGRHRPRGSRPRGLVRLRGSRRTTSCRCG